MSKYNTLTTIGMAAEIKTVIRDSKDDFVQIKAPYLIDDSKFCPTKNALENLKGQVLTDEQIAQAYDFADGKDNGSSLPIARGRYADITEVEAEFKQSNDSLKKSYDDFTESEKRKAKQQERLDALLKTREVTQPSK